MTATVQMLLTRFQEKGIIQVTPTASIVEATKTMKEKNISSLLIVNDEDLFVGILSERDIAWKLVLESLDPENTKVGEIMTPKSKIITVTELTTLSECLDLMRDNNIRHLPVMNHEDLVGIVSIKDIARHLDLLVEDMTRYILGQR